VRKGGGQTKRTVKGKQKVNRHIGTGHQVCKIHSAADKENL